MTTLVLVSLLAVTPVIREMSPAGAQRGSVAKVTLKGDGLTAGAKVESGIPGTITKLLGEQFTLLVEVPKTSEVGVYPLRVRTEDGLSNLVLFSVGSLPEAAESEKKHSDRATAQALSTPVTLNGSLDGAEVDYFSIDVRAPRKLVIEIDARRAGSAIDPAFEVEDATGKVIARSDDAPGCGVDARAEVAFARPGKYFVRVHDSKYSAQVVNFYRLKLGEWKFADAIFPVGGAAGRETEFTLSGGNLAAPLKTRVTVAADRPVTAVRVPDSASLPFHALPDPAADRVEHKRFSKAGDKHEFTLDVKPGEEWMLELAGRSAAPSEASPFATVKSADGKKIATRDDVANPFQALPFRVPEGVSKVVVTVEDLIGGFGDAYGYRVAMRRSPPDFVAVALSPFVNIPAGGTALIQVDVRHRGFDGPVTLKVMNAPAGVRVAGGHVPAESTAQSFNDDNKGYRTSRGMLTLTAPDEAPLVSGNLKIVAVAETPAGEIVRDVIGPGLSIGVRGLRQGTVTAPWLGIGLPFSINRAWPVKLQLTNPLVRMSQGNDYTVVWRTQRRAGAKPAVNVRDTILGVGNLRIGGSLAGPNPDTGTVSLQTNFATPAVPFDLLLSAEADINGKTETIYAPLLEVDVVPGYEVIPAASEVPVRPSGAFALSGRVRREPTFEGGLVKIDVQDLPENVACQAVEVAKDAREFSISCEAKAAAPGTYELRLSSAAPETGSRAKAEYKGPDAVVKLRIAN